MFLFVKCAAFLRYYTCVWPRITNIYSNDEEGFNRCNWCMWRNRWLNEWDISWHFWHCFVSVKWNCITSITKLMKQTLEKNKSLKWHWNVFYEKKLIRWLTQTRWWLSVCLTYQFLNCYTLVVRNVWNNVILVTYSIKVTVSVRWTKFAVIVRYRWLESHSFENVRHRTTCNSNY